MMDRQMNNYEDELFVAPEDGCPECGERNVDVLAWEDDEIVVCLMCGCRYQTPGSLPGHGGGG
jgi:hypothetical protein